MSYKEIVTKAIVGKGKKVIRTNYCINPEETPNTVLGCWIINHHLEGKHEGARVEINGSFDINVWYSYAGDTKTAVTSKNFEYQESMTLTLKENSFLNDTQIITRNLKIPTVNEVSIEKAKIKLQVVHELGAEIVGDSTIKIQIIEDEDEYEEISSQNEAKITDQDLETIDAELNEDYIQKVSTKTG